MISVKKKFLLNHFIYSPFHQVIEKFYCTSDDMAPSLSLIYDIIQTHLLNNLMLFPFVIQTQKVEWTFVQFQVQFTRVQVSKREESTHSELLQLDNFCCHIRDLKPLKSDIFDMQRLCNTVIISSRALCKLKWLGNHFNSFKHVRQKEIQVCQPETHKVTTMFQGDMMHLGSHC